MARILIIDDESDFLELLHTLLAREGHEMDLLPDIAGAVKLPDEQKSLDRKDYF